MIYLVDNAVPGEACVVDDDMDFAVPELGRLLDELVYVFGVQHISL